MKNQFEQSLIEQLTRIGDALEKLQNQYGVNQTIIADETIEQQTKPSRKAKAKLNLWNLSKANQTSRMKT